MALGEMSIPKISDFGICFASRVCSRSETQPVPVQRSSIRKVGWSLGGFNLERSRIRLAMCVVYASVSGLDR